MGHLLAMEDFPGSAAPEQRTDNGPFRPERSGGFIVTGIRRLRDKRLSCKKAHWL